MRVLFYPPSPRSSSDMNTDLRPLMAPSVSAKPNSYQNQHLNPNKHCLHITSHHNICFIQTECPQKLQLNPEGRVVEQGGQTLVTWSRWTTPDPGNQQWAGRNLSYPELRGKNFFGKDGCLKILSWKSDTKFRL